MVSYPYQMPSGIPGAITRPEVKTVEQVIQNQTTPVALFGVPVKKVNAQAQPIAAGDTPASIVGFSVRVFPASSNNFSNALGAAVPSVTLPLDLLKRGYMSVKVMGSGTPASQGPVYVRVANANGTTTVVGGVEAAADIGVSSVAGGSNVGTSTVGTLSATTSTPAGTYTATLTQTSSTATFNVTDPSGVILGAGKVGTQLTLDNGLSFKITAGGTPTTGDNYAITVAQNTLVVPGNTYFTGGMDANNTAEIAYNI